jgi:SAM-dependent methyltransferase
VRWDAAWVKQGTQELKEYLGDKFEKYFDSSWALAQDWSYQSPKTEDEIERFYATTSHYLYNSLIFYESGDRKDLKPTIAQLVKQYDIKSVLDYGCGVGNDTLPMLEMGLKVYSVDFCSPSMEFLKWRIKRRGLDKNSEVIDIKSISKLPSADLVWTVDVLEHMLHPEKLVDMISAKTKSFAAFIDNDDKASGRHPFHISVNKNNFGIKLKKCGFVRTSFETMCFWQREIENSNINTGE